MTRIVTRVTAHCLSPSVVLSFAKKLAARQRRTLPCPQLVNDRRGSMDSVKRSPWLGLGVLAVCALLAGAAFAADSIKGQVLGGGSPIAKSTVTLWEASAGAPKQLGQAKANDDGRFEVRTKGASKD